MEYYNVDKLLVNKMVQIHEMEKTFTFCIHEREGEGEGEREREGKVPEALGFSLCVDRATRFSFFALEFAAILTIEWGQIGDLPFSLVSLIGLLLLTSCTL
ncbi:hypothetical protein ACJX0J_018242, partial [Zea mays]